MEILTKKELHQYLERIDENDQKIIALTHLGNGDHIICNGMLRQVLSLNEHCVVETFCWEKNTNNIKFMFRDEPKINVIPLNHDLLQELLDTLMQKSKNNDKILIAGYDSLYKTGAATFDQSFYCATGVDFKNRFEKFYIERSHEREDLVYQKIVPKNQEYIYVHDDPSRGFIIDPNKIKSKLTIVSNSVFEGWERQSEFNLFEMRKVIENAKEIHTMQTGMFDFCNSIDLSAKIFVHLYVRGYSDFVLSRMNPNNNYELIK